MSLAFSYNGRLVIVLDEENIERLQENDPWEVDLARSTVPMALIFPFKIMIVYAKKDELAKIEAMREFPDALMKYLTRGYKETATDAARGESYSTLGRSPTSGQKH